jgi:hypothetical protein
MPVRCLSLRRVVEAASWGASKPGAGCGRGFAIGQRLQGRAVSIARGALDEAGGVVTRTGCLAAAIYDGFD